MHLEVSMFQPTDGMIMVTLYDVTRNWTCAFQGGPLCMVRVVNEGPKLTEANKKWKKQDQSEKMYSPQQAMSLVVGW